jgi:hypothetical protein
MTEVPQESDAIGLDPADLNGDGLPDLLLGHHGSVELLFGQDQRVFRARARTLGGRATDDAVPFGFLLADLPVDHFQRPAMPTVGWHPFQIDEAGTLVDFQRALLESVAAPSSGARPASVPYRFCGATRLTPTGNGRQQLLPRLDLTLASSTPTAQRGLIVRLPIDPRLTTVQKNSLSVHASRTQWLMAAALASDTLFGTSAGSSVLPRIDLGVGLRDVIRPSVAWLTLPRDDDLASGSETGARWRLGPDQQHIEILVESDVVVQAYYQP